MGTPVEEIRKFHAELREIRHDIHAHPELGFEENRTSDIVAGKLAAWGVEVHRGLARTGIVGIVHGRNGPGTRSVGLRADMVPPDALAPQPGDNVVERTGYSSFFRTNLESLLDELEIDDVLICGVLTNVGVLYTAVDALQRGIRVIVPETCVAALTEEDHKFALHQINEVLRFVPRE